jgi:twitching motility protein PilU
MDITPYLQLMADKHASDLFFSTGAPVTIKIEGRTGPVGNQVLPLGAVKQLAYSLMRDEQIKEFEANLEMNFSISVHSTGRFRINVYRQRGEVSMVIRYIKSAIPSVAELNLPEILNHLVTLARGLILVVGATGSGKSTTLAAMISHRNQTIPGHILTIEDPIEFMHSHEKCVVDQREVGIDTLSYANALKNAMREAPDVILIGEIRDRDTMQQAIAYAETGHLCLSTLHASNSYQALERILNFFPDTARHQLLEDMSLNLRAIVSQRLLHGVDGRRVPAAEVMCNSPYIADLIMKGEIEKIREAMEQSVDQGMCTFDASLFSLYKAGKITVEEALHHADSRNNLHLKIKLANGASESDTTSLSIDDSSGIRR